MKPPQASSDPQAGHAGAEAHWAKVFGRTWRRRCPRCGEGKLFETTFRMGRSCSECELVVRAEEGSMTGQMYLAAAVSEVLALVLAVVIWLGTDWGIGVTLAVLIPFVGLFSYWFLPKAMALWTAVDFLTDRYETAYTPDGPKGESSRKQD